MHQLRAVALARPFLASNQEWEGVADRVTNCHTNVSSTRCKLPPAVESKCIFNTILPLDNQGFCYYRLSLKLFLLPLFHQWNSSISTVFPLSVQNYIDYILFSQQEFEYFICIALKQSQYTIHSQCIFAFRTGEEIPTFQIRFHFIMRTEEAKNVLSVFFHPCHAVLVKDTTTTVMKVILAIVVVSHHQKYSRRSHKTKTTSRAEAPNGFCCFFPKLSCSPKLQEGLASPSSPHTLI